MPFKATSKTNNLYLNVSSDRMVTNIVFFRSALFKRVHINFMFGRKTHWIFHLQQNSIVDSLAKLLPEVALQCDLAVLLIPKTGDAVMSSSDWPRNEVFVRALIVIRVVLCGVRHDHRLTIPNWIH